MDDKTWARKAVLQLIHRLLVHLGHRGRLPREPWL